MPWAPSRSRHRTQAAPASIGLGGRAPARGEVRQEPRHRQRLRRQRPLPHPVAPGLEPGPLPLPGRPRSSPPAPRGRTTRPARSAHRDTQGPLSVSEVGCTVSRSGLPGVVLGADRSGTSARTITRLPGLVHPRDNGCRRPSLHTRTSPSARHIFHAFVIQHWFAMNPSESSAATWFGANLATKTTIWICGPRDGEYRDEQRARSRGRRQLPDTDRYPGGTSMRDMLTMLARRCVEPLDVPRPGRS